MLVTCFHASGTWNVAGFTGLYYDGYWLVFMLRLQSSFSKIEILLPELLKTQSLSGNQMITMPIKTITPKSRKLLAIFDMQKSFITMANSETF